MVRGVQQTIVSVLMKRQVIEQSQVSLNLLCGEDMKICSSTCSIEQFQESHSMECHGSSQECVQTHPDISPHATGVSAREDRQNGTKEARKKQGSQLVLMYFFKRTADSQTDADKSARRPSPYSTHADVQTADPLEKEDCTMMTRPVRTLGGGFTPVLVQRGRDLIRKRIAGSSDGLPRILSGRSADGKPSAPGFDLNLEL